MPAAFAVTKRNASCKTENICKLSNKKMQIRKGVKKKFAKTTIIYLLL